MQNYLTSILFVSINLLTLIASVPITSSSKSTIANKNKISSLKQIFNVSDISADFAPSDHLDKEATEFFSFYQNELALRNQQALAWDMANVFFTGTSAAEGCVFQPGINFNHKMALCGINVTGMLFGMTSIMLCFQLSVLMLFDNDYVAFGDSKIASLREKLPFVFEHIDAFRETETFAYFSNLNIQVDVSTISNTINQHKFNDWIFNISTGQGAGSVHGLELSLSVNQYLFRMMANSRYVNLPTKVIKNLFKLLKTEYPMIKNGQIADFIFTLVTTANQYTTEYTTRMLTLFSKLSAEDMSKECSTTQYGFGITDPKQDNISVINIKGYVNC
ncbi:hypothetical protein ACO0OE_001703 [Hanseniaspora uvarum]